MYNNDNKFSIEDFESIESINELITKLEGNINKNDITGLTPLCFAALNSINPEMFVYLASNGKQLIEKCNWPLGENATIDTSDMYDAISNKKAADVTKKCAKGKTPIDYAVMAGNIDAVKLLRGKSITTNKRDKYGNLVIKYNDSTKLPERNKDDSIKYAPTDLKIYPDNGKLSSDAVPVSKATLLLASAMPTKDMIDALSYTGKLYGVNSDQPEFIKELSTPLITATNAQSYEVADYLVGKLFNEDTHKQPIDGFVTVSNDHGKCNCAVCKAITEYNEDKSVKPALVVAYEKGDLLLLAAYTGIAETFMDYCSQLLTLATTFKLKYDSALQLPELKEVYYDLLEATDDYENLKKFSRIDKFYNYDYVKEFINAEADVSTNEEVAYLVFLYNTIVSMNQLDKLQGEIEELLKQTKLTISDSIYYSSNTFFKTWPGNTYTEVFYYHKKLESIIYKLGEVKDTALLMKTIPETLCGVDKTKSKDYMYDEPYHTYQFVMYYLYNDCNITYNYWPNTAKPNTTPSVQLNVSTAEAVPPGDPVILTAIGTDPDEDDTLALTYSWGGDWADKLIFTNTNESIAKFIIPSDAKNNDEYNFTVTVTDKRGATATASTTVRAYVNSKPVINSITVSGDRYAGDTITLTANVTDSDNDTPFAYKWTIPGDTRDTLYTSPNPSATFKIPAGITKDTDYTFKLTVTDCRWATSDPMSVTVTGKYNHAPVITSLIATPSSGHRGNTINLSVEAYDQDSDQTLTYLWTSTPAVTINNSNKATASFTIPSTASNGDIYQISVTVTDSKNKSATASASVTAIVEAVNRAPVVSVTSNSYSGQSGTSIVLDASGSYDPDGDTIQYYWGGTDSGKLSSTTTSKPTFNIPTGLTSNTTYTVTLYVQDIKGLKSNTVTITITGIAASVQPSAIGKLVFTSGAFVINTDQESEVCPWDINATKLVVARTAWDNYYTDGYYVPTVPKEPYSLIYDENATTE